MVVTNMRCGTKLKVFDIFLPFVPVNAAAVLRKREACVPPSLLSPVQKGNERQKSISNYKNENELKNILKKEET